MNDSDSDSLHSLPDLKEVYRNINTTLGDENFQQYTNLLKLYFTQKLSKLKFDEEARKVLTTPEQLHLHNLFLLSLSSKITSTSSDGSNVKYFAQEMCLPNKELLKDRITIAAFDNELDGAESDVADVITIAVQNFIKNIVTAVISRSNGYKLRENNFQHAIGLPAPNPWLRNTNNIIDPSQESNITIDDETKTFEPVPKENLDSAEQQAAFSIACSAKGNSTRHNKITLKCLYETLLENPHIINNNSISSVILERILSQLDSS